jgi:hypothetical protein
MASKERELLEQIGSGKMRWGPVDRSTEARERFQSEAEDLMEILDNLITDGFIGDYTFKRESYSGNQHIVRVAVKEGLTLKGQDRREWPD